VSAVWTVDYARDLLLVGGLLPEAAWLAQRLGDWKTAAVLGLAYTSYRDQHFPGSVVRLSVTPGEYSHYRLGGWLAGWL